MGEKFNLQASLRDKKESPKRLRRDKLIPAVLYGPYIESQGIKVKRGEFEKIYNQAGESSLVNLTIDKKTPEKILIKDIQRDPVKQEIIHADFYQVKMDEKIYTEIPLSFIGEAKAVKELGGYLTKNLDSLEVECLPGDLVQEIEVDISTLETFDDEIKVKDLQVPKGIEVTTEAEELVAMVVPSYEEEEVEEKEEAQEGEEVAAEKTDGKETADSKEEAKEEAKK